LFFLFFTYYYDEYRFSRHFFLLFEVEKMESTFLLFLYIQKTKTYVSFPLLYIGSVFCFFAVCVLWRLCAFAPFINNKKIKQKRYFFATKNLLMRKRVE